MKNGLIITVGRQFGSGGGEIGRILAEDLGIPYYDKKLITEAARRSGLSSELFEEKDEKTPGTLMHALSVGMGFSPGFSTETLFQLQSDTIREIAAAGPCVIVGRCADYVLRDYPECLNIFIHAPEDIRIQNVMRRTGMDEKHAAEKMEKTDKTRAAYYDFYTDKKWGRSSSYHLSVDSSVLGLEQTIVYIKRFAEGMKIALG